MCYLFFHLDFEAKLGFFFFFFSLALGFGDLRWKFVLKKIAMTVKVLYETNLLGEVTD